MSKFTGIRFYLRDKDKWSNFLKLHAGFDASFVLDKTTDSANISFIVQNEPECIQINSWVALFINADSSELEFNADGTPKNHEQFIVGGYQYYKTLAGYEVTMKLIEPIERFRGVLGETLSYTNQTSKEQDGHTYTKDPYNYYTALKRWLQVTPANTDDISRDSEKKDKNGIAWWNRITILDKAFLESLPFADDTFNELSLYDLLLDVYDSGTGRTPVAYFDLNTQTGQPNNLKRDEYLLKFIRQNGADKPILEWDELTENKGSGEVCTGIMKREDGANYATGLVANVTNLSPNTTVTFPAQGVYVFPEAIADVRETKSYRDAGHGQWGLMLPHKIKTVKKIIEYRIYRVSHSTQIEQLTRQQVDRTFYERKQKDAVIENLYDENVDYYDEGDNIIYLSHYKYSDVTGMVYLYYVEYEPLIDSRILIGNNEYIQQINQTASQVDSDKFGKFMENYLAGMGKADYTIQRTTEKPEEYINLIGSKVRRNDKMFMITNVALRNRNFQYDVFFQLNENHLRKNMSYQSPQNIRANTAIQYENIKDRKVAICEKLKLSITPITNNIKYLKNKRIILNLLGMYEKPNGYPQFANVTNTSVLKTAGGENRTLTTLRSTNIATYICGNNICINVKFLNNAIAGKSKEIEGLEWNKIGWVKKQIPTLFTDAFGEVEKSTIDIISAESQTLSDIVIGQLSNKNTYNQEVEKSLKTIEAAQNIFLSHVPVNRTVISMPDLNLQKDMLEDLNVTYNLEVVGDYCVYIFPKMLEKCRLVNGKEYSAQTLLSFYEDYDGKTPLLENYHTSSLTSSNMNPNYIKYHYNNVVKKQPKSIIIKQKFASGETIDCVLINNYNNMDLMSGFNLYF